MKAWVGGRLDALRGCGAERGSAAVEAAILTPALVMLVCLALAAGLIVRAGNEVDAAAKSASRAASISRDAGTAKQAAFSAARESLSGQIACSSTRVSADTSALNVPVGQVSKVTVTVRCTVDYSDLLLPAPGSKTLTGTWTSTVDRFRQRGNS
ncbi:MULTISPECIES: TadE family protein [unclassified Streptomyces]|uniref:TadE family protein n=1 Tax=unclassified Streptomyces TaxID=2593676 RepID=UPI002DD99A5D|nr:TadE family protein [Streptomyces sp. NBC_01795]WSA97739.1 pilus assembly protein [Streptomyces sp. NBC_01795]WSS46744.1 pilus assembly protein [Streptomyces sp. NBC_01187]WSS47039.1 pilus assembly protein [Streptomyces sp. NBC_01187]